VSADVVRPDRPPHGRHRRSVPRRPGLARAWTALAITLATVGIGALLPTPAGLHPTLVALAPFSRPVLPAPSHKPEIVRPMPASRPVSISIPALGVTSRVMRLGLQADGSMQVPPGAYPAGWYDRSPTPGERGPSVLAGHVDWGGQLGVFGRIRRLTTGDDVVIARADGSTATFRVDSVAIFAKSDFPTDAVYGDTHDAVLRLVTCGGAFDDARQSYVDNVVVFASLVRTTAPKPA
jgi:sortase (surface protein transpeptidase)